MPGTGPHTPAPSQMPYLSPDKSKHKTSKQQGHRCTILGSFQLILEVDRNSTAGVEHQ